MSQQKTALRYVHSTSDLWGVGPEIQKILSVGSKSTTIIPRDATPADATRCCYSSVWATSHSANLPSSNSFAPDLRFWAIHPAHLQGMSHNSLHGKGLICGLKSRGSLSPPKASHAWPLMTSPSVRSSAPLKDFFSPFMELDV